MNAPDRNSRPELYGLDFPALGELVRGLGGGPRMAATLFRALYHELPSTVEAIRGVRPAFLQALAAHARLGRIEAVQELSSGGVDAACKLVMRAGDGAEFETVVLPDRDRLTLCISSQVGCRMGCAFCQTGRMGLVRNLTAAEIVLQVVLARSRLPAGRTLTNLVYMGMGEPMDNFEEVWRSYLIVQDRRGLAVPRNRITISSVGHLPGLERLAQQSVPVNLALSLNASDQQTRARLMPASRPWPIERLLELVDRFPRRRHRSICLEYVLLGGVNDRDEDLERLATMLAGHPVKVNLIAYNPVPGLDFERPAPERVEEFASRLAARGIWTMVRDSRGTEVMGACGQLGKA
jgi:23S rRNA (adenine2503-C2)-methyltransferase